MPTEPTDKLTPRPTGQDRPAKPQGKISRKALLGMALVVAAPTLGLVLHAALTGAQLTPAALYSNLGAGVVAVIVALAVLIVGNYRSRR